jgi:hypothetical protein
MRLVRFEIISIAAFMTSFAAQIWRQHSPSTIGGRSFQRRTPSRRPSRPTLTIKTCKRPQPWGMGILANRQIPLDLDPSTKDFLERPLTIPT